MSERRLNFVWSFALTALAQLSLLLLTGWLICFQIDEGEKLHIEVALVGGCLTCSCFTSIGMLWWSVTERDWKLSGRLLRAASLSNCGMGLMLVVVQEPCMDLGDNCPLSVASAMILGCGAMAFLGSFASLILAACFQASANSPTIERHLTSSLLDPLVPAPEGSVDIQESQNNTDTSFQTVSMEQVLDATIDSLLDDASESVDSVNAGTPTI